MKKLIAVLLILFLFIMPLLAPVIQVQAASGAVAIVAQESDFNFFDALMKSRDVLLGMTYLALLGAAFGNYLKSKGKLKDNQVPIFLTSLGVVVVVIFTVLKYFLPDFNLLVFDEYAALLVESNGAFTPLAVLLLNIFAKVFHTQLLRGIPTVGYSFSLRE